MAAAPLVSPRLIPILIRARTAAAAGGRGAAAAQGWVRLGRPGPCHWSEAATAAAAAGRWGARGVGSPSAALPVGRAAGSTLQTAALQAACPARKRAVPPGTIPAVAACAAAQAAASARHRA